MALVQSSARSWVLQECERILEGIDSHSTPMQNGCLVFETGYGPSGLPHIGTFAEVVRTMMVINTMNYLRPDISTRLIVFSDDMDGLRKIPDNIPNKDKMQSYLGMPLTSIPDPLGEFDSFGAYMNNRLRMFLDNFGFADRYEFKSSTECYRSGIFNHAIKQILSSYDDVKNLVLPILGEERQRTYHPILPISQSTGRVLIADIKEVDPITGSIVYEDESGKLVEGSALSGRSKMQWKIDWGLRWAVLGVNYEMHGKDMDSSAVIGIKVCELLGKTPPVLFRYEMFQDDEGKKISKSKGNGLSTDEWLAYAPRETLALYMYANPHRAKSLSFGSIPKTVDEYLRYSASFFSQEDKMTNPLWYVHNGNPPNFGDIGVSFSMMLNLACACNPDNASVLYKFIEPGLGNITAEGKAMVEVLVDKALKYYNDKVKPYKKYKQPEDSESSALMTLHDRLLQGGVDDYQELVLSVGEGAGHDRSNMKPWFHTIYSVLFGQDSGPRVGTFISIYGPEKTAQLIAERIGESS